MARNRSAANGFISASLFIALATASSAPTLADDALNWFLTAPAHTCTASDANNSGTFQRTYVDPQSCGSLPRYQTTKGSPPWSTLSFVLDNGYIKLMIEISYGSSPYYRAFRDLTTGSKEIPSILRFFTTPTSWGYPPYTEEYWTDSTGKPVCYNTQHTNVNGSLNWSSIQHLGKWAAFLQDKRTSSPDKNKLYDIDVILVTDQWGSNNYEYYSYGQWTNPYNGQVESLGLVKWEFYQGSTLMGYAVLNQLATCDVVVSCSTCPP